MQPLLLAIETATRITSVALLRGDEPIAESRGAEGGAAAETLLPEIDRLLREQEVSAADLDAFAVSIGPGSFTGLRVGLATLKGLAFGSDRPVARVPTLTALAWLSPRRDLPVAALLDARRGEMYAAVYDLGDDGPRSRIDEGVYGPDELIPHLPPECILVGEGAELFGSEIRDRLGAGVVIGAGAASAAAVGWIGARMLARGEGVAAADLVPHYVRRAEAEVQRTGERFESPPRPR
ncbi:MAG: tRNA (adenosine(37)-N6)-threonylcarbamoyltransferase complex dimerization subunit type 1 TsaB [Deltaproteobacteria bacterium]|nr:tRNA (adenosine(37)-N6)-threonylcarbamoyltransferase complex dimerization subunit type 1 TsaB [Deltaproteobacteria bacterium]